MMILVRNIGSTIVIRISHEEVEGGGKAGVVQMMGSGRGGDVGQM